MGLSEQVAAVFTIIISLAVVLVIVAVGWWLIWKVNLFALSLFPKFLLMHGECYSVQALVFLTKYRYRISYDHCS
jgi:hypothetical protein